VHPLIGPFDVISFKVGPLEIAAFGMLVAAGFYFGGNAAMARAKKIGLEPEHINKLLGYLVVGTLVGGHVGYGLMYAPEEYFANPILWLQFWKGLSSFGGFAVCVPLSFWYFWKHKLDIWRYTDCLAYGLALGWFLGRMGCFTAHDHPGTVTDFWLGVYGMCPGGDPNIACHDMGLYEALWSLGMFFLFKWMDRKPRTPGVLVTLFWASYGPVRFFMDFLRPESTDVRYLGLTPGQYWSVAFTVVAVWFLVKRIRSGDDPGWTIESAKAAEAS